MGKRFFGSYLFLAIFLILLLSLPKRITEPIRGRFFSIVIPFGSFVFKPKKLEKPKIFVAAEELTKEIVEEGKENAEIARVVFRSPSSWNSSLWIDKGSFNNLDKENPIIALNSPVLFEHSLIGLIDYLGKKQSRVKLITDSSLSPSVRAVRGQESQRQTIKYIAALEESLRNIDDSIINAEHKEILKEQLNYFREKLFDIQDDWFLAKGKLLGSGKPMWRKHSQILQGIGFNCEFADELSPSRDLRTGSVISRFKMNEKCLPIILEGDLLITTGLDGFFPKGLKVARVTKVFPLQEGSFAYSIEARPCALNLDECQWVQVIAPIGFDLLDQPSY